jgi:pimeloyl-ACP methyl ester carboxylesterase
MTSAVSLLSAFNGWSIVEEEEPDWMKLYTEELAYVERQDGLGLEGAVIHPIGIETKPVAIMWIHGNTSRFYDLPYIEIGREMAALGYTFITSNTHGHDIVSPMWGREGELTPGGACWERFDETPMDLAPWIDLAIEGGAKGVVLVGHSFGANKVVYYQAAQQDPRVLGVACASGDVKWKADPDRLALAEQMEAEGHTGEVLPYLEAAWYQMSARTFLSRARIAQHIFSSDTQTPYIAHVHCPVLAFYGTNEEWCGTADDLEMIRRNATNAQSVDTHLIEGADHVYWGQAANTARLIAEWVEGLVVEEELVAA